MIKAMEPRSVVFPYWLDGEYHRVSANPRSLSQQTEMIIKTGLLVRRAYCVADQHLLDCRPALALFADDDFWSAIQRRPWFFTLIGLSEESTLFGLDAVRACLERTLKPQWFC